MYITNTSIIFGTGFKGASEQTQPNGAFVDQNLIFSENQAYKTVPAVILTDNRHKYLKKPEVIYETVQ